MTVHVGLDRDSMEEISWEKTLTNLANLAALARILGIRVCLENLARGWTSRPDLYEKLIRKTNCWGTLDIGHAQVKCVRHEPNLRCRGLCPSSSGAHLERPYLSQGNS